MRPMNLMTGDQARAERNRLIDVGLIVPSGGFGRLPRWNNGKMNAEQLASAGYGAAGEMKRRVFIADLEMRGVQPMQHSVLGLIKR